jgi:Ca2+-binding EF-hand superfamily protein
MSRSTYDEEINEIRKGFEMFDVENKGQIDPFELKETIEDMNLKYKNSFIYELITSLCLRKDIKSKGGLTSDEYISILQEKISDVESKQGIKTIYEIFSDSDNKVPMPTFYQVAKEVGDEEGGVEIRNLVGLSKTGGKEIDFNEFYYIMKEKNIMNKYNYNSNKMNKSANKSQSKGKNIDENESGQDTYEKKYLTKNNEKKIVENKTNFVFMEKNIVTEEDNDSPLKANRYHYKFDMYNKLKDKEDNRVDVNYSYSNKSKNNKEEIYHDEKDDGIEVKRYHRRFRENRTNTENN